MLLPIQTDGANVETRLPITQLNPTEVRVDGARTQMEQEDHLMELMDGNKGSWRMRVSPQMMDAKMGVGELLMMGQLG